MTAQVWQMALCWGVLSLKISGYSNHWGPGGQVSLWQQLQVGRAGSTGTLAAQLSIGEDCGVQGSKRGSGCGGVSWWQNPSQRPSTLDPHGSQALRTGGWGAASFAFPHVHFILCLESALSGLLPPGPELPQGDAGGCGGLLVFALWTRRPPSPLTLCSLVGRSVDHVSIHSGAICLLLLCVSFVPAPCHFGYYYSVLQLEAREWEASSFVLPLDGFIC